MAEARLNITFAGPLVSLQDAGRFGGLRYGVSPSGPMDRLAFAAAHAALDNLAGATAIEISLGGLSLTCQGMAVTVAITGGNFSIDHNGQKSTGWQVITLQPDDTLNLKAGAYGSWAYLAVAGDIGASKWMGSTARHSKTNLGSAPITSGSVLVVTNPQILDNRIGAIPMPVSTLTDKIRVVLGPQDRYFEPSSVTEFLSKPYIVAPANDRMGMRLDGATLRLDEALSIPSEPILRGCVQVSGDGIPTVLLADHQSTGGYPKIATVVSNDTDVLSQRRGGDKVQFEAISPSDAVMLARETARKRQRYLDEVNVARGTLEQRLMSENLIHGHTEGEF